MVKCFICDSYGEKVEATRDSINEIGERVCEYHYYCEVDDSELL